MELTTADALLLPIDSSGNVTVPDNIASNGQAE